MSEPQDPDAAVDEDAVEPLSDSSRAALEAATRALITSLTGYFEAVRDIPGDLSVEDVVDLVFPADESVTAAVRAWNEAAYDHTEMAPLHLVDDDLDLDDLLSGMDDEDDDDPDERPIPRQLSIISRYDVEVTDPDALFTAAVTAQENQGYAPEDNTPETVRRDGVGNAIYAIKHGDTPYSDVPGISLLGGRTLYLALDPTGPDPAAGLDDDTTDSALRSVLPPTGHTDFLERW